MQCELLSLGRTCRSLKCLYHIIPYFFVSFFLLHATEFSSSVSVHSSSPLQLNLSIILFIQLCQVKFYNDPKVPDTWGLSLAQLPPLIVVMKSLVQWSYHVLKTLFLSSPIQPLALTIFAPHFPCTPCYLIQRTQVFIGSGICRLLPMDMKGLPFSCDVVFTVLFFLLVWPLEFPISLDP